MSADHAATVHRYDEVWAADGAFDGIDFVEFAADGRIEWLTNFYDDTPAEA